MFRVALESVLGFDVREGRLLALRPCIPEGWPGFTVRFRLPGGETAYEVVVERGRGAARATTAAWLDGAPLAVEGGEVVIPLVDDGAAHRVRVRLGDDAGRRYAPCSSAMPLEPATEA
jgi:cyclic beta-1,2-glucan synthetase